MRLIDVDKVTDGERVFDNVIHVDFEKGGGYVMVDDLLNILDNQPTAYDVDKIVERLEEMREEILSGTEYDNDTVNYYLDYADSMIDIVKSGGISKE